MNAIDSPRLGGSIPEARAVPMQCDICETDLSATDTFCPHCRLPVANIYTFRPANEPATDEPHDRVCPVCGFTTPADLRYGFDGELSDETCLTCGFSERNSVEDGSFLEWQNQSETKNIPTADADTPSSAEGTKRLARAERRASDDEFRSCVERLQQKAKREADVAAKRSKTIKVLFWIWISSVPIIPAVMLCKPNVNGRELAEDIVFMEILATVLTGCFALAIKLGWIKT